MDEYCFRIGPPWTAEEDLVRGSIGDELTIDEYVSKLLLLPGGCGSKVGIDEVFDCTVLEEGDSFTEDEIGSAFYITIQVKLAAVLFAGIESILVADEAAVPDDNTVSFHVEGHCLPYPAGCIFDGEVFCDEIIPLYEHGIGIVGAEFFSAYPVFPSGKGFPGKIIAGDDGAVFVFSNEGYPCFPGRDHYFFVVDAFFNMDGNALVGEVAYGIDGFLYGLVVAAAILCHGDGGRVFGILRIGVAECNQEDKGDNRFHHLVKLKALKIMRKAGVSILRFPVMDGDFRKNLESNLLFAR